MNQINDNSLANIANSLQNEVIPPQLRENSNNNLTNQSVNERDPAKHADLLLNTVTPGGYEPESLDVTKIVNTVTPGYYSDNHHQDQ